jgi:hypothetical protein
MEAASPVQAGTAATNLMTGILLAMQILKSPLLQQTDRDARHRRPSCSQAARRLSAPVLTADRAVRQVSGWGAATRQPQ